MRAKLMILALIVGGCASSRPPETPELLVPPPPPAVSAAATEEPPLAIAPPRGAVEAPSATTEEGRARAHSHVTVIEEGGHSDQAGTLAAASRAERSRRASDTGERATITITDKNLKEYATGELTFAAEKPAAPTPAAALADGQPESWWRGEIRARRQRWADLVVEIQDLELRAAALRDNFYAESDPWRRDSRIKPDWDRTLDRLAAARDSARLAEREVSSFLDYGQQANAFPGWLREGIELEPSARPYEPDSQQQRRNVGEPVEARQIIGEPRTVDE